jgi:hypothetical protein
LKQQKHHFLKTTGVNIQVSSANFPKVALTTTYSTPKNMQSGPIQSSNRDVLNIKDFCFSVPNLI